MRSSCSHSIIPNSEQFHFGDWSSHISFKNCSTPPLKLPPTRNGSNPHLPKCFAILYRKIFFHATPKIVFAITLLQILLPHSPSKKLSLQPKNVFYYQTTKIFLSSIIPQKCSNYTPLFLIAFFWYLKNLSLLVPLLDTSQVFPVYHSILILRWF